jgi:hypothetical protein
LLSVRCETTIPGGGVSKLFCCGIHLNLWMKQEKKLQHKRSNYSARPFTIRRSSLLLRRELLQFPNVLPDLLSKLLTEKVCALLFSLCSCLNLSCYFIFS